MAATSEVPDWLKENADSIETSKVHVDSELGTASNSGSLEVTKDAAASPKKSWRNRSNNNSVDGESPSACARCIKWTIAGISLVFLILFVTSATFQHNDSEGSAIVWWLFYILHAVLAAACLFLRCGRGVTCIEKPVQILAVVMLLFSMGLVGYSIYLLTDATESNAGPDAENFNDKEEKAYEVAGAGLGLVSAIFHVVMWQCCSTKKNKNDSDSGDEH